MKRLYAERWKALELNLLKVMEEAKASVSETASIQETEIIRRLKWLELFGLGGNLFAVLTKMTITYRAVVRA